MTFVENPMTLLLDGDFSPLTLRKSGHEKTT